MNIAKSNQSDLDTNLSSANSFLSKTSKTILVRTLRKIHFINSDDIVLLKAERSYTSIHLINNQVITASKGLFFFEELLESDGFFKTSRSFVVAVKYVVAIDSHDDTVEMKNGNSVPIVKNRIVPLIDQIQSNINSLY